ncbi:hypothetical protein GLOIN_2v1764406 [Rhizophagus irregularis DAOM 181602=DAOM 197198]|nr:hypothetical protein GLOIN_2v1764406 [Rhizophagus irregularis DAOM 181602=DAOM 197198]
MFTTFSSLTVCLVMSIEAIQFGDIKRGVWSHKGFHIDVFDNITVCILAFSVNVSTQGDKLRGPSWKFSGSIDNWKIEQLY